MSKVIYYVTVEGRNPVKEFITSIDLIQVAKIHRVFEIIKHYGLLSAIRHFKKISNSPLWEIRILGKDNIRVLYAVVENESVLVLHGFIKKKQKTPQKELSLALSRYYEWKKR